MNTITTGYTKNLTDPNNDPLGKADASGLRPNDCCFRKDAAVGLLELERLNIMMDFSRWSDPVEAYTAGMSTPTPEMAGLLAFTEWEIDSGRIRNGPRGSLWWEAVNGSMVLDIQAADRSLERAGLLARSKNPRIQAWIEYKRMGGRGDSQRALWRAHQRSLHWAIDCFQSLYDRESGLERDVMDTVVDNVDVSAFKNFPSDEIGSKGMYWYLGGMLGYPNYKEASGSSGLRIWPYLLTPERYQFLRNSGVIGMDSGWYWEGRF